MSREQAGDDRRHKLIEKAEQLFARHSYAGTSLQMIADELGFSKGAIYHHFRTREELLSALIAPLFEELATVVTHAEAGRTPGARAERMLAGYATLATSNRSLVAMLHGDPGVLAVIRAHPEWSSVIDRQMALFREVNPGPAGRVRSALVMAGFAGAVGPELADLDAETLRDELVAAGRRTLGLRISR